MALNVNKLKQRRDDAANKGNNKGGGIVWRPEEGEQEIRMLPHPDGDPFRDFYIHYNVARGGVLCPKRNFDEPCPICDFASDLWRNAESDEDRAQAKKLFVKQRFFSAIVVRDNEEMGPKLYSYGEKAYKELLDLALNPKIGDFTCVEQGQDFTLKYEKPKTPGAFPQTTLTLLPVRSALVENKSGKVDQKAVKELLEAAPDVDSAVHEYLGGRRTPAQVKEILDAYLSDPDGTSFDYNSAKKSDQVTDLDDAVEQLQKGAK